MTAAAAAVRLNLGAATTKLDGYIPIDRMFGTEAYPLTDYADGSVDEVRASHLLEHFPHRMKAEVLKEWVRVLKPGGKLKIAVPDWDKMRTSTDPLLEKYAYGGQIDDNDYHKSGFNEGGLKALMESVGVFSVSRWNPDYPDCSSLPISLNLEGYKGGLPPHKTLFIGSIPRYGALSAQGCLHDAAAYFRIPVNQIQGAYWAQCLSRAMVSALRDGFEWMIAHDYDTVFSWKHVEQLMKVVYDNPTGVDAVAPLQVGRGRREALIGCHANTNVINSDQGKFLWFKNRDPIPVDTAHFGLTLMRVSALRKMPQPWFEAIPDINSEWGTGRLDEDVNFWLKWRGCGNTLYVHPDCRVGHIEEMVSYYDDNFQVQYTHTSDWRAQHGYRVETSAMQAEVTNGSTQATDCAKH